MRKIIALVFVLMSFQSYSQIYVGPRGGLLLNSMTNGTLGLNYKDLGSTGYAFGIGSEIVINDMFSFTPGLQFTRKGTEYFKDTSMTSPGTRWDNYKFNYLEFPLTMKGKYDFEWSEVYLLTGPQLSFIVGGTASEQGTAVLIFNEYKLKDFFSDRELDPVNHISGRDQDFHKIDFGWIFAAGFATRVGPGKIFLETGFDLGFIEVAGDQRNYPYKYQSIGANRSFFIQTGYLFEL